MAKKKKKKKKAKSEREKREERREREKEEKREEKEERKKEKKEARKDKKEQKAEEKPKYPILTSRLKKWITSLIMMVIAIVVAFSFFDKAGRAGSFISKGLHSLIGKTIFFIPFLFFLAAAIIFKPPKKRVFAPVFLGLLVLIIGVSGALNLQAVSARNGGWLGYAVSWPLLNYFGMAVSVIVCSALIIIGCLILWEFIPRKKKPFKKGEEAAEAGKAMALQTKKGKKEAVEPLKEAPKFEIKTLEFLKKKKEALKEFGQDGRSSDFAKPGEEKYGPAALKTSSEYKMAPLELFDKSEDKPTSSGDIEQNALIIKKTLQDFGISVEMSEVSIGPTVTQYTLKPAEGVKLSKITTLNNDLALALAAHPIRIEAPIPGRSLVGIEVPNKVRVQVKMGKLIAAEDFQKAPSCLTLALGRNVMGAPIFSDLGRMPHMLVAGATGSGKTVCLNSLILSLIYRNPPEALKLILIDPKRVEFPVYADLPHLLTPVIFNSQKVVNVLGWLVGEMERRFDVLKEAGARDIVSFNKKSKEIMPYIVIVIDELADLMAAKGREMEGGIVRLSQLARAVGIHLIVATQRPSVEVITGLIKANITSRIAFQVASQVDSRTILDMAGAEKLLGRGDMLFISTEFSRPKRVQGGYVSTSEIKKVVNFIKKNNAVEQIVTEDLSETLERGITKGEEIGSIETDEEEPLFGEAKDMVIQYQKASASLLQRRLKIGYARAARILDMLEERGVVGPQEGSKAREVFPQREEDSAEQKDSEWESV